MTCEIRGFLSDEYTRNGLCHLYGILNTKSVILQVLEWFSGGKKKVGFNIPVDCTCLSYERDRISR